MVSSLFINSIYNRASEMSQHVAAVAKVVLDWFPGRGNAGLRRKIREAWIESETLEGIRRTVALSPSRRIGLDAAERELRDHCSLPAIPSYWVAGAEGIELGPDVRFRSKDEAAAAGEVFRSTYGREYEVTIVKSNEPSTTTFGRWNVQGW